MHSQEKRSHLKKLNFEKAVSFQNHVPKIIIRHLQRLILQVFAQITIPGTNLRGISEMCIGENMFFIS